ncbi:hypothetical protein [Antrihabitans cavernicola]|uniref:hypothetical protein n=1 Tax=Antrihabitans cavernicola TaxID=2495913 RepID=UPI0016591BE5|nr:hypothetical protein [Spelaeibacter cavernicola]
MSELTYATHAIADAGSVTIDDIEKLSYRVATPDVATDSDDLTPERLCGRRSRAASGRRS